MKKMLATLLTFCFFLGISCPAYAMTPANWSGETDDTMRISDVYSQEDLSFRNFEAVLREYASKGNAPAPLWVITSLHNHQDIQAYYFPNKDAEGVESYYTETFWETVDESVDFFQVGAIMESPNWEPAQLALENNPLRGAMDILFSYSMDESIDTYEIFSELKDNNIPVYWNIEDIDSEKFILEIAIGKYEIQPGDCLSILAERFNTTVDQLMSYNQNITNPDLIYAGDFLVVK